MSNGNYFSIGKWHWEVACGAGILHAATLLVMARGSLRDNATTRWSADAVARHARVDWRRAKRAIDELRMEGLVTPLKGGKRPVYKLARPQNDNELIWLPNTLVDGAGDEIPPVARLRQAQDVEILQAFIELYGLHDLPGDGGLPRSLVYTPFERTHICNRGPYRVYGFDEASLDECLTWGPLARFADSNNRAWDFLETLERFGLLERVDYLAEGTDPEAELLHALNGDDYGRAAGRAVEAFVESLPTGFMHEAQKHQYAVPFLNHFLDATVVGVYRLTYRPHTSRTTKWYAQHADNCRVYGETYANLARGEYQRAA